MNRAGAAVQDVRQVTPTHVGVSLFRGQSVRYIQAHFCPYVLVGTIP